MVGSVDKRPHSLKSKINWNIGWLADRDKQNDLIGDWLEMVDSKTYRCNWYKKVILNVNQIF